MTKGRILPAYACAFGLVAVGQFLVAAEALPEAAERFAPRASSSVKASVPEGISVAVNEEGRVKDYEAEIAGQQAELTRQAAKLRAEREALSREALRLANAKGTAHKELASLYARLPADKAAEIMMALSADQAAAFVEAMPAPAAAALLEAMPSDSAIAVTRALLEKSSS
ncbi:hypothetical protein PB2503_07879 [Parvularcula bermudensis HTCC2503]|uniref:Magnesium transporter MgtE intracellular domain-containing protein n=1 Tax=Parvularcula bermudensis (strain ATCC BAA-594 / HTCC2503 / KCTC 12087) TaxID=314260 RepID=E0TH47_PARBH|nr:hypothetical protein [Parvularcula bermudensis]ADM09631.1 hypothetical protein PB2503_07879 [Parvularcula bermudensis HTCC2503]